MMTATTVPHREVPAPAAAAPAPARATEPSRPRLTALDGLRFVAAAAVVVYHLTARQSSVWDGQQQDLLGDTGRWTSLGSLGPELFFVISGFVLAPSAWGRSAVHVVASRVARLYPAYWVGVLATGGLLLFLWLLWTAWRLSLNAGRVAGDRFGRQMAIGYGAAVIALVISCMFGDRFYQVTIGGNFWVYSALITDLLQEKQAGAA